MAYGNVKRTEAAEIMGTKPGTLDRIMGTKGTETKLATWSQLQSLAERAGLPPEWFSADLRRLAEIVTDGPVFVGGTTPTLGETADKAARRLAGMTPKPKRTRRAVGGKG